MNQFSGGEKENTWLSSERDGESSVTNSNCSGVRMLACWDCDVKILKCH